MFQGDMVCVVWLICTTVPLLPIYETTRRQQRVVWLHAQSNKNLALQGSHLMTIHTNCSTSGNALNQILLLDYMHH